MIPARFKAPLMILAAIWLLPSAIYGIFDSASRVASNIECPRSVKVEDMPIPELPTSSLLRQLKVSAQCMDLREEKLSVVPDAGSGIHVGEVKILDGASALVKIDLADANPGSWFFTVNGLQLDAPTYILASAKAEK